MHKEVRLVRLSCQITEDSTGADEPYLIYNGEKVWGPRSLNDGQSAHLGIVRPISGQAEVTLMEEDSPDPDDFLGSIHISEGEIHQGLRSQKFTRDDANYTLFYRVTEVEDDD